MRRCSEVGLSVVSFRRETGLEMSFNKKGQLIELAFL